MKPPVAQVSFPTFGLGTAASVPTGTTAAAPAANLQEAFNQLAPGLGDVIEAANAKKEGTATAVIGQTGHVDQGGHVNAPVRPLRPYHATSPRARVDPYPAFSPGQPGCGIARPLVAYPDQCAGVGRHADEPKRRCPFAGPRCAWARSAGHGHGQGNGPDTGGQACHRPPQRDGSFPCWRAYWYEATGRRRHAGAPCAPRLCRSPCGWRYRRRGTPPECFSGTGQARVIMWRPSESLHLAMTGWWRVPGTIDLACRALSGHGFPQSLCPRSVLWCEPSDAALPSTVGRSDISELCMCTVLNGRFVPPSCLCSTTISLSTSKLPPSPFVLVPVLGAGCRWVWGAAFLDPLFPFGTWAPSSTSLMPPGPCPSWCALARSVCSVPVGCAHVASPTHPRLPAAELLSP